MDVCRNIISWGRTKADPKAGSIFLRIPSGNASDGLGLLGMKSAHPIKP